MKERKLHKCSICKQWFNTTDDIMFEHAFQHNPVFAKKMLAVVELVIKKVQFELKAKTSPFPLNVMYATSALLCVQQLDLVMHSKDTSGESKILPIVYGPIK